MQHKIVRADGTVLDKIKSVRYTEQVIDGNSIRLGTAIANCLEVEAYGTGSEVVNDGEVLTYYQVWDVEYDFHHVEYTTEVLMGTFTAISSIPSQNTYSFVAYDNIYKLNADFSARLKELENSFPMSPYDLLQEVASVAGVSFYRPDFPFRDWVAADLNYFYADGITCRDIVSAFYELRGLIVDCIRSTGEIFGTNFASNSWGPFRASNRYIVCPTDQETYKEPTGLIEAYPAFYKENGLIISDYEAVSVDGVILKKNDGTVLYQHGGNNLDNPYIVSGNILLDNFADLPQDLYGWIARDIQSFMAGIISSSGLNGMPRNVEAHIFPFRNPFVVTGITSLINTSGTRVEFPIMKMVVTDSEAVLYSFTSGMLNQSSQSYMTPEQTNVSLASRVNQLEASLSDVSDSVDTLTTDVGDIQTTIDGLGSVATEDVVPIDKGGTGATTAAQALINLGMAFRNATPATAGPIETVCPFEGASKLSMYFVNSGGISDQPISGTNATAFVFCFGGSANNHVHILVYTSTNGIIGRMFMHTMRGGSTETWKEITMS